MRGRLDGALSTTRRARPCFETSPERRQLTKRDLVTTASARQRVPGLAQLLKSLLKSGRCSARG